MDNQSVYTHEFYSVVVKNKMRTMIQVQKDEHCGSPLYDNPN